MIGIALSWVYTALDVAFGCSLAQVPLAAGLVSRWRSFSAVTLGIASLPGGGCPQRRVKTV